MSFIAVKMRTNFEVSNQFEVKKFTKFWLENFSFKFFEDSFLGMCFNLSFDLFVEFLSIEYYFI